VVLVRGATGRAFTYPRRMLLAAFMGDAAFYTLVVVVLLAIVGFLAARFYLGRAREQREAERTREAAEVARQRAEQLTREQRDSLVERFGAEDADRILRHEIWQGQTEVMLIASRGAPADEEEHVMKTKTKRTYKYDPQGANRYGLRVFVENGVVVGWEGKK
jgi:type II secretory pathway pseudopilin PulG